jgi:two-component system, NtrC family, response regulator AtoC
MTRTTSRQSRPAPELSKHRASSEWCADSVHDSLSLLAHEVRRARFLDEPFVLLTICHEARLPSQHLLSLLRPIDVAYPHGAQATLVYLARAGKAEAARFASDLLAGCAPNIRVGAVLSTLSSSSPGELVSRSIDAAMSTGPGEFRCADGQSAVTSMVEPLVLAASMRRLYELATAAARTPMPVLIIGETGSGKEWVARAVHEQSLRASASFKAVNCAALSPSLIISSLFGHERGAFTGAHRQSAGLFEQTSGGTLLLDEVAELSPDAQGALLRVLECGTFVRVGGSKELRADVRLVAATHRDLTKMVDAGSFRADLLYRLDAFTLQVPPLRARVEEIAPLAERFLAESRQRWGAVSTRISVEAQAVLAAFPWPGNVRQLRNVIERAAAISRGPEIAVEHLPESLFLALGLPSASAGSTEPVGLNERLRSVQAAAIRDALERSDGNQTRAALLLGVPRRTFAYRVRALGITLPK